MSNHDNHRRAERKRTEHGPTGAERGRWANERRAQKRRARRAARRVNRQAVRVGLEPPRDVRKIWP